MVYVVEVISERQRRLEVRPSWEAAQQLAKSWRGCEWFAWAARELLIHEGPDGSGPLVIRERWANDPFTGETTQQWDELGQRLRP